VTGQLLSNYETDADVVTLDLTGQKSGVYFISIRTNRGEQVQKVVLMQTF
jgi:hypothetical protein